MNYKGLKMGPVMETVTQPGNDNIANVELIQIQSVITQMNFSAFKSHGIAPPYSSFPV